MLLYNRQQRTLFFATQTALYNETLSSAIAAQQSGRPLTEEETQVWNREKAVLQAEAEQEKRKALGWRERLFGSGARAAGAKEEAGKETMEGEKETLVDLVRGEGEEGVEGSKGVAVQPVGEVVGQGRVMQALQEKRRAEEGAFQGDDAVGIGGGGGQLDRVAEEAVEKGKQEVEKAKKGGWGSWFGGNR